MPDPRASLTLVPGTELPEADWHAAFTAAFSDYLIGPFRLTLAQWPGFLARQGVDLGLSRAAVVGGQLLAFALAAPRPGLHPPRWRLGTMGAVPEARGAGLAPRLLDDFLSRAAAHGAAFVELEVFAANERAVRLYQGRGFQIVHGLYGYERAAAATAAPGAADVPAPQALALDDAWAWLDEAERRLPDLPLQVTSGVLAVAAAAAPGTLHAWRAGEAQLVFAERPGEPVQLHGLVDRDPAQAGAHALANALAAAFPGRLLRMPALQRADIGGDALAAAGFVRQPMHQWLMRRAL
ncbi:MAG: GNAT family N-acetyltransferase [Pseudomonadota bacterium]